MRLTFGKQLLSIYLLSERHFLAAGNTIMKNCICTLGTPCLEDRLVNLLSQRDAMIFESSMRRYVVQVCTFVFSSLNFGVWDEICWKYLPR